MNWNGIISLLFFCIEIILLVNVIYFGRHSKLFNKGALIIGMLAFYQLAEFLICGLELTYSFLVYTAFLFITFLPPLGLLFVLDMLNKRFTYDRIIFLPAAMLLIYYFFYLQNFQVVKCSVIYAVYSYPLGDIYGMFYYLPVAVTIFLLFSGLRTKNILQKRNTGILLAGYMFVSLPVLTAFILHFSGDSSWLNIIESIMCKSAIVLAVCYSYVILNSGRTKIE
jgi:hypothetical protein